MDATPSEIGATAEREVACALIRAGHHVYAPMFAPHLRVDLVADIDGRLLRLQVKSARLRGDVLFFPCCSYTANTARAYAGEIDAFGVYSPDHHLALLVPIADVPERGCHLRLTPPRNNQQKGVRYARDYLIRGER